MLGRLYLLAISLVLLGCQPVPLRSGAITPEKPRPVQPLPWKGQPTVQTGKAQQPKGFKVADPTAPKKAVSSKATTKSGAANLSPDMAAKLVDAEDKAESALSMQQSAQTKEDWNLVFDRWKLAIQIAKSIPGKNPQVQQKIAEFQNGLEQATQDAKISLNPSLAPVDPIGSKARGVIGTFGNDEKDDKKPANPTPTAQPQQPTTSSTASPAPESKTSPEPQANPQSKQ